MGRALVAAVSLLGACGPTVPFANDSGAGAGTGSGVGGGTLVPTSGPVGDGDGTDAGTTDTGIGFIMDPDGGGAFECDPWEQDCPDGTKCMPYANDGGNAWNATKCTPLDPNPRGLYELCMVERSGVSGIDNCELGAMCWNVDPETMTGVCFGLCQGPQQNPTCEDPEARCNITSDGALILCFPRCDPIAQDCGAGLGCYPISDSFECAPDASGPDDGVAGDPCEFLNACDPGVICINAASVEGCMGSQGCCAPICDLTDPTADANCPGFPVEACEPWFDPMQVPRGFENVGVCAIGN